MNRALTPPTEAQEQAALLQWARLMTAQRPELALLFHCPLGGLRDPVVGAKLKRQGATKGFPDLFLPVPRGVYHGLMIELKRVKGGVVKPEQAWWLEQLDIQNYCATVCKGAGAAIAKIEEYLRLPPGVFTIPPLVVEEPEDEDESDNSKVAVESAIIEPEEVVRVLATAPVEPEPPPLKAVQKNACRMLRGEYRCNCPSLGTLECDYYKYTPPPREWRSPKAAHYCDYYVVSDGRCYSESAIKAHKESGEWIGYTEG
jgi:hypothetical protein